MKSKWYHSRKKIDLTTAESTYFMVCGSLYITVLTIYLIYMLWTPSILNKLILDMTTKNVNTTNNQAYTIIRISYIMKYLTGCAMGVLLIFTAYLGRKKISYGYLFPVFWIIATSGLISVHIYYGLIQQTIEPKWLTIISIISLSLIFIGVAIFLHRLKIFRDKLLFAYIQRIKTGKEKRL